MHLVRKQEKAIDDNSYMRVGLLNAMAIFVVAIFMPTTALCSAMGQVWPLVLMASMVTAGTVFGLLLHQKRQPEVIVPISFAHVPDVPRNDMGHNFKKAA